MRIALYQPDIPQNTGTLLRLGACLGVTIEIIEPCGFVWDDRRLRRAGMDYIELSNVRRYSSWERYLAERPPGRLLLLTTRAAEDHLEMVYRPDDTLLLGRESAGVPEAVHERADARLKIGQKPGTRSLNVAIAAAIVTAEALRQLGGFPQALPSA